MPATRSPLLLALTLGLTAALLLPVPAARAQDAPAPPEAAEQGEPAGPPVRDPYAWMDPIIDVQRLIAQRFVTEPDLRAMQRGAIRGMLDQLDDPYTQFVPSEVIDLFDKQTRGEYVGIGAQVREQDGWPTIVTPMDDSPALAAGLLPGDRIVEVDGESTMQESLEETIERIAGEPATTVTLTIEREGERLEVPIERRAIVTRSVKGFARDGAGWDYFADEDAGVGFIRLENFNATAAEEFREALTALKNGGARAVIVDLRFNGGGLLQAAIDIADMFLTDGVIVTTRGRAHDERSFYATDETLAPDMPLLVMVSRRSASASEVLGGALKDHDRAVVLGTRSFGKGLVQNILPLPSGLGELKVTEQRYFGPSGRMIQRTDDATEWGVDPTDGFFVRMTQRELNDVLRRRSEDDVINGGAAARPDEGESPEAWVLERYGDRQLAKAIEAVRLQLDRGEWVPVADEGDERAPEREELLYAVRARDYLLRELEQANERVEALSAAADPEAADALSLLPDDAALDGGRVEVYDDEGNLVGTLRIVGENLERWLVDAPLERAGGRN